MSEVSWRLRIWQAWLLGYLERDMHIGTCQGRVTPIVFNTFSLTTSGLDFLSSAHDVLLPVISNEVVKVVSATCKSSTSVQKVKLTRQSKGTHLLPVIKNLLSSKSNWFTIDSVDDYYFPGKFRTPYPQRLAFASDITTMPFYVPENEHFLFTDIQIGKGKLRAARSLKVAIDGKEEHLIYRIAPCGGVKACLFDGCSYTVSTRELKSCPDHPESQLKNECECPVEFVYIWPENKDDKRRWLSGIVRQGDMTTDNLHNHPLHQATKIPSKVISDIQKSLENDSTLKTHDIQTG